jgi:exopolyphosphatase/guanosine-5'-triphosphate,3'-diphosphate pyrophosphatase
MDRFGRSGRSARGRRWSHRGRGARETFAALDLGTNNCRLMVAERAGDGFRVVDGYSEIVRLGGGLGATGALSEAAMSRTMGALAACADKLDRHRPAAAACVATQACRVASNGRAFLERVEADLGLRLRVIEPAEEARLAVLGCAALADPAAEAVLVIDIGGGSTELSWIDPRAAADGGAPAMLDWTSAPTGVVSIAETEPEYEPSEVWYGALRARLRDMFAANAPPPHVLQAFARHGHVIGTSGTITSLAGVHLGLTRYQRTRVDSLWMSAAEVRAAARQVRTLPMPARARHPCVGPQRADLVVPGCAILEAILDLWPVERLRVADRGLREGLLMTLIAEHVRR